MTRGAIWAAKFSAMAGALLWMLGALCHVQIFIILITVLSGVVSGFPPLWSQLSLAEGLLVAGWLLLGPVITAVGGGMRFFAGIMSGNKIAGRHAPKIIFLEWLRYELHASGFGVMAASLMAVGMGLSPLWTLLVFVGGCLAGVKLFGLARARWDSSQRLMWEIRDEGIGSGMVPYPSGAVPAAPHLPHQERSGRGPQLRG